MGWNSPPGNVSPTPTAWRELRFRPSPIQLQLGAPRGLGKNRLPSIIATTWLEISGPQVKAPSPPARPVVFRIHETGCGFNRNWIGRANARDWPRNLPISRLHPTLTLAGRENVWSWWAHKADRFTNLPRRTGGARKLTQWTWPSVDPGTAGRGQKTWQNPATFGYSVEQTGGRLGENSVSTTEQLHQNGNYHPPTCCGGDQRYLILFI